jgi:hypothetical protein
VWLNGLVGEGWCLSRQEQKVAAGLMPELCIGNCCSGDCPTSVLQCRVRSWSNLRLSCGR